MTKDKYFFQKQSDLTASKITIYEKYITAYLPKLLLTVNEIFIADLFCGPGKNGEKPGSPIILLEQIKYIFTSPVIKKITNPKITILFNDQNSNHIDNLKQELKDFHYDDSIIQIIIKNESYSSILPWLLMKSENTKSAKFFFLDPFTYSDIGINDIKKIMSLNYTEVLLFNPTFHSYRFANTVFKEGHKTRVFIEEFTVDGIMDYESIHTFLTSIKKKLIFSIKKRGKTIPYVRYILLDGGGSKNSLFLLTWHQKGMLEMNKIAFKLTPDGENIKNKPTGQIDLFGTPETYSFFQQFEKKFEDIISKGGITNKEIIDFTIREGFLPKDAKEILKVMSKNKVIEVQNKFNETLKSNQ